MEKMVSIIISSLIFLLLINIAIASNVGLIENNSWQQNLTLVHTGSTITSGDLNDNNLQDLILIGAYDLSPITLHAEVYINNGTSLAENVTWQQNLTGVLHSSIALGDIDRDNDLDLIIMGCSDGDTQGCNSYEQVRVYINNGTSLVENVTWQQNFTTAGNGALALGDIDNDGDLDLVMTGRTGAIISKIYINNGTSFVEDIKWGLNLQPVFESGVAFGDLDKDGDLDLALTGDIGTPADFSAIYINNGTSFVSDLTWKGDIQNMDRSAVIFGDYDNDDDLDLLMTGHTNEDEQSIYNNNGSSLVENQTLTGFYRASMAFGDYDNDGDLDLATIGHEAGRAGVWENNKTNSYNLQRDEKAHENISDNARLGSLVWIDIDNDTDLDLIVAAFGTGGTTAKVFINNNTVSNTLPQPPNSSFSTVYENNQLALTWGNGTDIETPVLGLYYNLRLGTSKVSNNVVSGIYGGSSGGAGGGGGANGYFGNMMQRKSITLSGSWLQADTTYYWSVQTIDTALAKSTWSFEQNFTTGSDVIDPVITLNAPVDIFNTTSFTITFNATISDDLNLTNVSLYGNWSGLHLNQSNSSLGKNNTYYIFTKNLTSYGDGSYSWLIQASDANNNSANSSERIFRIDTMYPVINLVTPINDSTWSSSQLVTFTYNTTDQGIANCSLIINNVINQTDDSITENAEQTFTQTLPNTYYNFSINCTDSVNYLNRSETRKLRVYYEEQGSIIDNPSRKSGSSATETKTINNIPATETKSVEFTKDLGITEISITPNKDLSSVSVTVNEVSSSDSEVNKAGKPSEDVYKYLKITSKAKNEDISKAQISFKIPITWFSANNYNEDKVNLMHYTNAWNSLPTKKISKDTDYVYYTAETNGFSLYAITAEKNIEIQSNETKIEENITEEIIEKETSKQPTESKNYVPILILIFIGIICYLKFYKEKKR